MTQDEILEELYQRRDLLVDKLEFCAGWRTRMTSEYRRELGEIVRKIARLESEEPNNAQDNPSL